MAPRKAVQVENLWAGLLNNDSEPLTGGKVYTYETGTTTPKAVYLDRAKTTPATNPVELDTYGRAEVYGDGLYRFVVKDSSDVTLYTIDDLEYIPLEGGTLDDIDIGQTTPGKGKFTNLEFTTDLTDANGNIFTALGEKVEFQQQTIDAGVAAKDPVYYDTVSSSWKKADLAGNDPEGIYVGEIVTGNKYVVNRGLTAGFTGLIPNTKYYLDTMGGITTSETVWYIGRAISATQMIVQLEKRSKTTASCGDVLSILETAADIEKFTGGQSILALDNYIMESFNITKNINILLDTSYTGGTTLVLDYKIEMENGNYLPLLITDSTGNNNEIVWLTGLASGSTGAWTYNIATALSNNYTTANASYVTNCTGTIGSTIMGYTPGAPGVRARLAKIVRAFYTKEANLLKTFLGSLDFYADAFDVDLTNFAASKTMDLQTTVDRSGEFKDNNYVIIFPKFIQETPADGVNIFEPSILSSPQTANINWYMFQMNGNATFSTPDLTVTVDRVLDPVTGTFGTTMPDLGATLTNYKAIRVPASLFTLFGAKTSTTLTEQFPVNFIIKNKDITYPSYVHSHWKLDETSGGSINQKQPSGLYNLAQVGTVPSAAGKIGNARGPFTTSNILRWPTTGGATVYDSAVFGTGAWFKTSSTGATQNIISKRDLSGGVDSGWQVVINTSNFAQFILGLTSSSTAITGSVVLTDGNWHHIFAGMRATSGTNEWRLYVDGSVAAQSGGRTFTAGTTASLAVGAASYSVIAQPFLGVIDDPFYMSTMPTTWAEMESILAQVYARGVGRTFGYGNGYSMKYKQENIPNINKGIMIAGISDEATGVNSQLLKMTGALI